MAVEPPLLLMDEPFGAVDPIVRERLQDEFLRLQATLDTTVIFITHDVDEAIKMGTRVAVMEVGGKLAQYSAPADLLAHPASDYVARFVGADRALKRLALFTLAQVPLSPLDGNLNAASAGERDGLRLPPQTNLRDALAALVAAPAHRAVVADGNRVLGSVTLQAIVEAAAAGHTP